MGFLSPPSAVPGRRRGSTVGAVGSTGIVPRAMAVWPIARRAASNVRPPSASRTRIAFPAPSAGPSIQVPPGASSGAVSPRACVGKGSRVTPSPSPPPAPVARACAASIRCAPRLAGSRSPRVVPPASSAPTVSMARVVSRIVSGSGVPMGNGAPVSGTSGTNVSRSPRATVATTRAPTASAATCACLGAAPSSGAPGSVIRSARRAVLPSRSAGWVGPPSAPAFASVTRCRPTPVARVGPAPRCPRT